jgi:hypothetical protein
VQGVALPFGDEAAVWWIDASGAAHDHPIADAELLPGGFILSGLVDAHAHPAVGSRPAGLVALDQRAARANLLAWAQTGITLVRDVGSRGGVTLELRSGPGMPMLQAAGWFLAPAGRYFPDLLDAPVTEANLISAAVTEIGRGARWVKVIADFPDLAAGTDAEATYRIEAIAHGIRRSAQQASRTRVRNQRRTTTPVTGFCDGSAMGHLLGYARVSTTDQHPQLQVDALQRAGCDRVFTETASGARADRPTLEQVLDQLRPGDTLVVWKLDRLGRSLRHLVDTVTSLVDRGVGFRSLQEAIDTTTPAASSSSTSSPPSPSSNATSPVNAPPRDWRPPGPEAAAAAGRR